MANSQSKPAKVYYAGERVTVKKVKGNYAFIESGSVKRGYIAQWVHIRTLRVEK